MRITTVQLQKKQMINHLMSLPAVFKTMSGQFYSVTLAANSGKKYQVTFWDEHGRAVSDTKHNDVAEIAEEYWAVFKRTGSSEELDHHIKTHSQGNERHALPCRGP
jgi:hypothetical protein